MAATMEAITPPQTASRPRAAFWAGRIVSGLVILMLGLDGVMRLVKPAPVTEAMAQLGYPDTTALGIGLCLLICTTLYAVPRTALLGAILLTGYLGGATASHIRVGAPLFPVLFPSIIGLMVWGGLFLRDARFRALLTLRG